MRVRRTKAQIAADNAMNAVAADIADGLQSVVDNTMRELQTRAMNAYALRIWKGQSISAPEAWRVNRVIEGLKAQGYDLTGLVLPVEDIGKYL